MKDTIYRSMLLATTVVGLGAAAPAMAQQTPGDPSGTPTAAGTGQSAATVTNAPAESARNSRDEENPSDIIVSARRVEERLQDVPISITVLSQSQLSDRNVVQASDLATYTPSLATNQRFGSDTATFALRGFTQELRTSASVATYFADVVAPRGGGSITAGDGTGPGSFFDLQNVQVLKGPQGTLFGRNTTGGAILLVPQKPTAKLEGYVEGSYGNYDMRRLQGVLNVPLGEDGRLRLGGDWNRRDGYLENVSGVGPSRLGNTNYYALRASLVVDLTSNLENYSIASYTHSKSTGTLPQLFACNQSVVGGQRVGFASLCDAQLAAQGSDGYKVSNPEADPVSQIDQWSVINTTTWKASDQLTIKNIASYSQLTTTLRTGIFGTNFAIAQPLPAGLAAVINGPITFVNSSQVPGLPTNHQLTFTEELQLQGRSADDRFIWQAGVYFERSEPLGRSGSLSVNQIRCANAAALQCTDVAATLQGLGTLNAINTGQIPPAAIPATLAALGAGLRTGTLQQSVGSITYDNKAIYAQATYSLTDQLKLTGGIRYTRDRTNGYSEMIAYSFPVSFRPPTFAPTFGAATPACVNPAATLANNCHIELRQSSEAPTWTVGLDYKPTEDILLYAKYTRGYRQGSVNIFGPPGYNTFAPEKVNTYEAGLKASFSGAVSGVFNISAFYNNLTNQQIQANFTEGTDAAFPTHAANGIGVPTTGILNAGKSRIWGIEVETTVRLFAGFRVDGSYTFLNTKLLSLASAPAAPAPYEVIQLTAVEGGSLTFSPKHKVVVSPSYTLPLDARIGRISLGATYVFTDKQISTNGSPYGVLPSYSLLNLNLNWNSVAGSPIDLSLFATNVTNKKYAVYVAGLYNTGGFESYQLGEPRMYGARVRVRFGH